MRNGGGLPSDVLGVKDEAVALGLNLAASHRLLIFDKEAAEHNAQLMAHEIGKMLFGEK